MKKRYIPLFLMLNAFVLTAQNTPDLEILLDRLEEIGTSADSFQMVLDANFNVEEQHILNAYYAKEGAQQQSNKQTDLVDFYTVLDIRNDGLFGTITGDPPFNEITVILETQKIAFADDFHGNGNLYALEYDTVTEISSLIRVDPFTGLFNYIGELNGLEAGHNPVGLSYNPVNGLMYALSTDVSGTQLYTVNLINGSLTPIGTETGNAAGIWIEIDDNGTAFMADISNDFLYTVNLTTGVSTPVGSLDISINFQQEVDYDSVNDKLIMAAYQGAGSGGIYEVNTTTGIASFIGQTNALNAEFGMFSSNTIELGVGDAQEMAIAIYPNPATDKFNVSVPASIEIVSLELFDVLGKTMPLDVSEERIDISHLVSGVYLLRLKTGRGVITQKLVKL